MNSAHDRRLLQRGQKKSFKYYFCFLIFVLFLRSFFVSADCGNMQVLESGGISCSLINEIVDSHNELRQSVAEGLVKDQPVASSMREFYWDEELANGAQDWANQCTFAHNDNKDREVARFQVGQNLALSKSHHEDGSKEKQFRRQITNWFNEHENFQFGPILKVENLQAVGHYTQVVWANTYLVGCGYSRYKSSSNVTYRLYVCHYGPTGNELAKEPYERGSQKCPENLIVSKKYPKLCSLKKPPTNPCSVKIKRNSTHVDDDGDTNVDEERKRLANGRRFLNGSPEVIETFDDRDESKEDDRDRMKNEKNIIFKIFFNFW